MAVIYYTFRQHLEICGARSLFESSNPPACIRITLSTISYVVVHHRNHHVSFLMYQIIQTSPLSLPAVSRHHLSNLIRLPPTRIANSQCSHAARPIHPRRPDQFSPHLADHHPSRTHLNCPFSLPYRHDGLTD